MTRRKPFYRASRARPGSRRRPPAAAGHASGPAACTCRNLRQAARAVTQYYDAVMQESGLKTSQFSLLAVVAGTGPIAMGRLAERQVMDRTTLTRNLRPLVDRGLLRVRPGEDRRARVISLTAAGRKAFKGALPLWQEAQAGMVRRLGAAEWRGLMGHLGAATEAARR